MRKHKKSVYESG